MRKRAMLASAIAAVVVAATATSAFAGTPSTVDQPEVDPSARDGQSSVVSQEDHGEIGIQTWQPNAFAVGGSMTRTDPYDRVPVVQIYGEWNWRDDLLYGAAPADIAAFRVNKSCGTWSNLVARSWTASGASSDSLISLRSAGIGESGPIWNVHDRVTNFENQADHGYVIADYDISSCPAGTRDSLQAEFVYQGIYEGKVTTVGIGWDWFEIGFEYDPSDSQRHSSGPVSVGESGGEFWTD